MVCSMISGCTVSRHIHRQRSYLSLVISLLGGEYGLLNDIWLYSFKTHTWTEIIPITSDQPAGR